jgi:cytoskeletal protein CcmA (bactofilin family)
MFSRGNRSASRRTAPSLIGADCSFSGDIVSEGEVQIDGQLDGDIRCRSLIIGEQGSVTGEIRAETVSVLGTVTGQISARAVSLARTARILGDIAHDSLSVEVGAYVEGRFNRLQADAEKVETAQAATTPLIGGPKTGTTAAEMAHCENPRDPEPAGSPKVALVGS